MNRSDMLRKDPREFYELKYVLYRSIASNQNDDLQEESSILTMPVGNGIVSGGAPGYEKEFLREMCRQLREIIKADIAQKQRSMSRIPQPDSESHLREYADQIKVLVRDNYKTKKGKELRTFVAGSLGFSPGYINEICKRETGLVFVNLVTNIKLYIASCYIRYGSESIAEIAEIVELSAGGLSSAYKKTYGISPINDRKIHAERLRDKQGG